MSAFETARDAVCERAGELAAEAAPDDLVKLADAVSKVGYGASGGAMDYRYTSTSTTTTRYENDRNGSRAGFAR